MEKNVKNLMELYIENSILRGRYDEIGCKIKLLQQLLKTNPFVEIQEDIEKLFDDLVNCERQLQILEKLI